jgi:hypothetical protein
LIGIVLAGFAIEVAVKQLPIFSLQSSLASAQLSSLSSVAATAKPAKRTGMSSGLNISGGKEVER